MKLSNPPLRLLLQFTAFFSALSNLQAASEDELRALLSVAAEGRGNERASAAWKTLVSEGIPHLLPILRATGEAGPVSNNWLRLAATAILDHALKAGHPIPIAKLEETISTPTLSANTRILAFDLLKLAAPERANLLEPTLLDDPVQELRRGAVQRLIDHGATLSGEESKQTFLKALHSVRDEDQTQTVVNALDAVGQKVDLQKHFGFLSHWQILGPFHNSDRKGFDTVFSPETGLHLSEPAQGKDHEIHWQAFSSDDPWGKIDFNKPFGLLKEVTAYATTTFNTETERDAELRLGCKNAWKIWLNGKLLFARDEYHRGQRMDQYKLACHLQRGPNTILIKCCQNEQKETWTAEWEFQVRVCDSAGTAIASAQKNP
jgi:hypothetical protein